MPNDPKKSGGEADDDDAEGEERPTAAPPFDPIAFAREVFDDDDSPFGPADKPFTPPTVKPRAPSKQPTAAPSAKPPGKDETPTAPPKAPKALPRFDSPPPEAPPVAAPAMKRKATPTGALSLANQRVPTVPPPTRRPQDVQPQQSKKPSARKSGRGGDFDVPELDTSPPPGGRSAEEHARSQQAKGDGPPTEQEMNDRVSLGDYTGALAIAEKLLETDPGNRAVNECAENCRNVLRQMYTARIGPLDKVPIVMVPRDQLRWLSIDHKAGFVLSLVDGVSSVEMILDVSGMQELDALRILSELAQQRIISFR